MPSASSRSWTAGIAKTAAISVFSLVMMSLGVPPGAKIANHAWVWKLLTPASIMVGTSGSTLARFGPVVPSARTAPERTCGAPVETKSSNRGTWPAITSFIASGLERYGTWRMETPIWSLSSSMARWFGRAGARRSISQFAGPGLGERDQFRHRLRRQARMRHQQHRGSADQGDRREILQEIEWQLLVRMDGERQEARAAQQRVAVRRRLCDRVGADDTAGARAAFDQNRLAEPCLQVLPDRSGQCVRRAARRERIDDFDRPVRVILRQPRCGVDRQNKSRARGRRWNEWSAWHSFQLTDYRSCIVPGANSSSGLTARCDRPCSTDQRSMQSTAFLLAG